MSTDDEKRAKKAARQARWRAKQRPVPVAVSVDPAPVVPVDRVDAAPVVPVVPAYRFETCPTCGDRVNVTDPGAEIVKYHRLLMCLEP